MPQRPTTAVQRRLRPASVQRESSAPAVDGAKKRRRIDIVAAPPAEDGVKEEQHVVVSDAPVESGATTDEACDTATAGSAAPVAELTPEQYLAKIKQRVKQVNKGGSAGSGLVDMKLLSTDAIYRIIHHSHRSDVVEIVKCKLGEAECERAVLYLNKEYMAAAVRRLRLQLLVPMVKGIDAFLPFFAHHRKTLRLLDLSRNRLNADDVLTLSDTLGLSEPSVCSLEVLDLSYNRTIGNAGATQLLRCIERNTVIRAVILKSVSITDEGAHGIAFYLRSRPVPSDSSVPDEASEAVLMARKGDGWKDTMMQHAKLHGDYYSSANVGSGKCNFFLNLNENLIGSTGVIALRRGIPDYVSLTIVKQHIVRDK